MLVVPRLICHPAVNTQCFFVLVCCFVLCFVFDVFKGSKICCVLVCGLVASLPRFVLFYDLFWKNKLRSFCFSCVSVLAAFCF